MKNRTPTTEAPRCPEAEHGLWYGRASLAIFLLLLSGLWVSCGRGKDTAVEPIRLGLVSETSSAIGSLPVRISEQLVRELNADGGVAVAGKMHPVELFIEDSQDTPEGAARAALRLINVHQVVALIGPNRSTNAIPVAEVAQQARVAMISPTASHPELTANRPYVFRLAFTDHAQARALADFARHDLQLDSVAILYNAASNYSRGIASELQAAFEAAGGEIVAREGFTVIDEDIQPALDRLLAASPQGIFLPSTRARWQARRLRQMGNGSVFLGSDVWGSETLSTEPALEGAYATAAWHGDLVHRFPEAERFAVWLRNFTRRDMDGLVCLTSDAIGVLIRAVQDAGIIEPQAVRDALANIEGFPGVMGPLTFRGTTGDPERAVLVVRVEDGKAVLVKSIGP